MAVCGLTAALIVGGVLVARSFVEARPSPPAGASGAGGSPATTGGAGRGAEAIEAAIEAAAVYSSRREYAQAEAILRRAVEEHPRDQPLRLELARALVAQQKFAQAYPEYEAALALDRGSTPDDPAGIPGGNEAASNDAGRAKRLLGNPDLHFEAGTIASKAGLLDRAEEHYSMAQSGNPADPRFALFLGMVQLRLNKLDAAQASLVRCVTLDRSQAVAWGTLAELALMHNDAAQAIRQIEIARSIDAAAPKWRIVHAKALKRRHDPGDVEHAAQLLLGMDRSELLRPEAVQTLAECYGLLSRPGDAASLYDEACRANSTSGELALAAAMWNQRAGRRDQALRHAKDAAMLGNGDAPDLVRTLTAETSPTSADEAGK